MGAMLLTVKPYVLALYAAFGIVLLRSAVQAHARQATPTDPSRDYMATGRLVLAGVAGLMAIAYLAADSVLLLCALGIAAFADKTSSPSTLLDRLSASAVVLSLVWWRIQPSGASPLPLAAFFLILVILLRAFRDGTGPSHAGARLFPIIVFLVAGVALVADLGGYRVDRSFITTMVHHWGAFIGPVLHVQAGLVPFYDVPLQYGLGPTVALAAACRVGGCWSGAHALFATTDVAMALLILAMALTTTRRRGWAWTCAVTAAIFSAAFLWPGLPSEGSLLMAMPSAGGVRFLPVTAVACLWFFGRPTSAALVAIPAVLWSPESAAMTVAVHGLCGTLHHGLRKSVISSAALLFGSYAALILLHRVAFGVWMDPAAFVEYVLHVPGPLPIDPLSDILLLGIVLGLGGWLAATAPEAIAKRRDMAATGLLFATAMYCLGRSHPNAICNLMPFLALVGVRALDRVQAAGQTIVAQGLAVSVAALAFSTWHIVPLDPRVGADDLAKSFPAFEADVASIRDRLPHDGKLGIADFGPARSRHYAETIVWTPMDPSSLWSYVPSERRQLYIVRSARRLGRSGWGIFAGDQRVLLDDLRAGYDVKVERRIDAGAMSYTVACFDPKPAVAVRVGSACPDADLNGLEMARSFEDGGEHFRPEAERPF